MPVFDRYLSPEFHINSGNNRNHTSWKIFAYLVPYRTCIKTWIVLIYDISSTYMLTE